MKQNKKYVSLFALFMILALLVVPAAAQQPSAARVNTPTNPLAATGTTDAAAMYIVMLDAPAVASYTGGISGLEATSPQVTGARKLDVNSAASQAYAAFLAGAQAEMLGSIRSAIGRSLDVKFTYLYAVNGFAAEMTPAEAAAIAGLPGVSFVQPEIVHELTTDVGPTWIGATGIWDGNTSSGVGSKGEGVIVGVLDTGINSTHPSFADIGGDGYDHTNPYGAGTYVGVCNPADPSYDPTFVCNDKLIGAWTFVNEPTTPEDSDGHGSHTASTAAGNVVDSTMVAPTISISDQISGVAPHANVIAYDVCVTSCPGSALLAATNQAIVDGVDVINYSISGGDAPWTDPQELAFLGAFNAGVFVSASAGNAGSVGSAAHTSPWVMSVAASTHNRSLSNSLVNMSGGTNPPADMQGKSFSDGYGPANIVHAEDAGDGQCLNPFPANTWTNGEIVVCDRGSIARVQKGANVLAGGAAGFVLANTNAEGEGLSGDPHFLPAVHVGDTNGDALRTWLDAAPAGVQTDHTATIGGLLVSYDNANGDVLASFSSKGPSDHNLLVPNVTAPGVDVWAAYCKNCTLGDPDFNFVSGTSMSSPHDAGAAALMVGLHPSWTPDMIKSAMMSTATSNDMVRKTDGVTPADPFDVGAGRIDMGAAGNAGFVLMESGADMLAANPASGGEPADLNLAAIADWTCGSTCSYERTLTSVLAYDVEYNVWVDAPAGVTVTVTPSTFTLPAAGSQLVTFDFDVSGAALNQWQYGTVWFEPTKNFSFIPVVSNDTGQTPPGGTMQGGDFGPSTHHIPFALTPVPSAPDINVVPTSMISNQAPDTVVTDTLEIQNLGTSPLTWSIDEYAVTSPFAFSNKPAVEAAGTGTVTIGDGLEFALSDGQTANTVSYSPLLGPSGSITITHNLDPSTIEQTTVACATSGGGPTRDNAYLRVFDLANDFGITGDFDITNVQFGVQTATLSGASWPVNVNLYTLSGPLLYANLTPIGTATMNINSSPLAFYNTVVTGTVPAGELLVVELYVPDASPNPDRIYLGSNDNGQTAPTYIASVACGLAEPTDTAAIGFPGSQIIMNVSGDVTGGQICDVPTNIPWLSVSPDNGVTPGESSTDVTVTYDATGLALGSYSGYLCVNSDDPDEDLVIVSVDLNVTEGGGWSDNFDSYPSNSPLHGVGGWKGWFNDPAAGASTSTTQARSAPNSVDILGGSDLVQEYSGINSGKWIFTAWQYIPGSFSGQSFFIMLNNYNDAGSGLNWSTQVNFSPTTVTNDGVSGGSTAVIKDQWVEIRVEIDLDADTQDFYYNNVLLYSGTWSGEVSGGGTTNIGALDLFANGASSVFYDDLSLAPAP